MREIVRLGLRLFIFTLVASLCLAGTYAITKQPIQAAEERAGYESRLAVMPDADAFEPLDFAKSGQAARFPQIKEINAALKAGEVIGYTLSLAPIGYKGAIPITVGITLTGEMTSMSIGDITETAGLGTKIKGEPFLSQFTMLPVADMDNEVDTISGATISSKACKSAALQAAAWFAEFGKGEGK